MVSLSSHVWELHLWSYDGSSDSTVASDFQGINTSATQPWPRPNWETSGYDSNMGQRNHKKCWSPIGNQPMCGFDNFDSHTTMFDFLAIYIYIYIVLFIYLYIFFTSYNISYKINHCDQALPVPWHLSSLDPKKWISTTCHDTISKR